MAHTKRTARKSTGGKAPKKAQLTPKNKPKGAPKTTPKGAPKTTTKGAPKFSHPSTGKFQDSTVFLKRLDLRAYFQVFNSFLGQFYPFISVI